MKRKTLLVFALILLSSIGIYSCYEKKSVTVTSTPSFIVEKRSKLFIDINELQGRLRINFQGASLFDSSDKPDTLLFAVLDSGSKRLDFTSFKESAKEIKVRMKLYIKPETSQVFMYKSSYSLSDYQNMNSIFFDAK